MVFAARYNGKLKIKAVKRGLLSFTRPGGLINHKEKPAITWVVENISE